MAPVTFRVTRTFAAAPDDVRLALADFEGAGAWMPNFVRMEALDPGAPRVGSRFRETRKVFGRESTEEFEIVDLAPRRVSLRVDGATGSTGRGEFNFVYTIAERGPGTEVVLDGEIAGMTGFASLVSRLMVGTMRKACDRDLAALDAYLAGRTPLTRR